MTDTPTHTLFDRGGLTLSISPEPTPAAVNLLADTLWGTPGGTRYQHLNTRKRIFLVPEPRFLQLHKGKDLLGVLSLSHRSIQRPNTQTGAWYIRYFAMKEALRRKDTQASDQPIEAKDTLLKASARSLFSNPAVLGKEDSSIFYAYVSLDNPRSRDMCANMGFEPVRSFSTMVYSRMFPAKSFRVRNVSDIEIDFVKGRIASQHAGNGFVPDWTTLIDENYWVLTEHSMPVAGMRATPVEWRMAEMPGLTGKIVKDWLPKVPILNRLFKSNPFRFVAVEAMFCGPGYEKKLHAILSHVCAIHGRNTVLFWMDEQDAFRDRILAAGKLGLLHRLNKAASIHVIARGLAPDAWERARPAYISALDLV